ncbi:hypothetical protein XPA_004694 [Xanthoria parietina]
MEDTALRRQSLTAITKDPRLPYRKALRSKRETPVSADSSSSRYIRGARTMPPPAVRIPINFHYDVATKPGRVMNEAAAQTQPGVSNLYICQTRVFNRICFSHS